MYDNNGYAGIPDELPSGYGYADSQAATVHSNMETAKTEQLFAPQTSNSTDSSSQGRGSVQQYSNPQNMAGFPRQNPNLRPGSMPGRQVFPGQQQAPRARVVGPRGFQASGRHTTPTNAISMRARQTEESIPSGVPNALRFEDLPGNQIDDDDDALGADYGLTADEKAAKKAARNQKQAAAKAARGEKKAANVAARDAKQAANVAGRAAEKSKVGAWQQAAQLGLRFDTARGKWYRDVKVASGGVEATQGERPFLKIKASGPAVQRLQKLLAAKGFPAGASGKYDEAVQQQVIAFQNSVGLEGDGKVGADTWEALSPTATATPGGRTVRQYQDGAVAVLKGSVPSGASTGVVLSPSKYKDAVVALQSEIDEAYGPFPLTSLTPPPANWDFKLGKMKPGFTLDIDKITKEVKSASGKFLPSGKAAPAEEAGGTDMSASSGGGGATPEEEKPTNWLLIGGIAAGVLVVGGLFFAFSGGSEKKSTSSGAEG
jgi:peptidoglycan hydrolase-like protein with peptidoglycan-binding domain